MSRVYVFCLTMALLCVIPSSVFGLPADMKASALEASSSNDEERRATWLETRNLEENFKELVYLSMQELASEGLVNPDVILSKQQEKRGRHQGFCFRKTKTGRFVPYICWKDGDQEEWLKQKIKSWLWVLALTLSSNFISSSFLAHHSFRMFWCKV